MQFKLLPRGKLDLFAMQEEILDYWRREKTFDKTILNRPQDNKYSFYDGPPFITGIPHYATLLPSIAKDIIPRFWTMKGKRIRRVWGWDCHGLPAETQVEKQLGIKSRREIEEMGIGKFVSACKDYVSNVSEEWRWYIDHIGRWVDMDHAYRTMDLDYMESVIWTFKQIYDQGLIYEGMRSSLYCTRCATPLSKFEITMDEGFYREVEDPAVTVRFKIKEEDRYLLAWTTTPWTLPGNRALAVDPNAEYVEVQNGEGKTDILGKEAYEREPDQYGPISRSYQGKDLVGQKYEPLYMFGPNNDNDWQVLGGGFVTMEEGTGIVHVAPAYGEDDFSLGQEAGLTQFVNIDTDGKFVAEVTPWHGQYIKKANGKILADLRQRDLLYREDTIVHSYPFCYRCETPLIYKAQKAWYLKINELREGLLKNNQDINWVPRHFKEGRFQYNLENAPDWCLSRTRYWGTPIPAWRCDQCDKVQVVGSLAEIEELSGKKVKELHRPDIDEVAWSCTCGGRMLRVPEILDVWFESGSMPYAEHHYPFENEKDFEEGFPADFVVEYTGQLRGWFYYLHVIAGALKKSIAFKNVVVTGVMKGNDGRKMSKSFGNYPDPKETIRKYGGEALRLYFMSNPIMQGEDMNVNEEEIVEHYRKTMMILWNSYRYFLTYADLHGFTDPTKGSNDILDRWITGCVESLAQEIEEGLVSFDYIRAARSIRPFVEDLSTWYIRRSRDRFVSGDKMALSTLYYVLVRLSQVAAPLIPFTAESIYRNLADSQNGSSVHLTDWQGADKDIISDTAKLRDAMQHVRAISSVGNSLRREAGVSLRQPLSEFQINSGDGLELEDNLIQLIKDELNVKTVALVPKMTPGENWWQKQEGGIQVSLNAGITEELKLEGAAREIIRHGQVLRREAGYKLDDQIQLIFRTEQDSMAEKALRQNKEMVLEALQAKDITGENESSDAGKEIEILDTPVFLAVKK